MPGDDYASAREVDMLREQMRSMQTQLGRVDGSAQLAAMQVQLSDQARAIADVARHQAEHLKKHEDDQNERVNGRRWAIGTAVAAIAALAGVYVMLFDLLGHAH